jgi:NAD(P)-dependent dehydrogenase (short-subunit alcohol dehydrogenase family)
VSASAAGPRIWPVLTPAELFDLEGRVAIVTGASSGLGERFVRVLSAAGARVVAAARRRDRLEALARDVERVEPVVCDVSVDADLERLVAVTVERLGRLDVVVNNAGVSGAFPAEDEPADHFRHVVEINLNAVFLLSRLAARVMLARGGGSVINMASMYGLIAGAPVNQASYCASKGGVVNLTRELGAQWARRGVRVNALAPGFFPSEMASEMLEDERSAAYIRRNTPMGRPGEPDELDGALLFLASDASRYVTGQTIAIDGGWTAR